MSDIKVKYGRDGNRKPIKTLVYFKENGVIYFGISKCHKNDAFVKDMGKLIAYERAELAVDIRQGKVAKQKPAEEFLGFSGFVVDKDELYRNMLDYFDSL